MCVTIVRSKDIMPFFLYELRMYRALLTDFIYGCPSGRKGRTQHPTLANEEADPEGSVSCKVMMLITMQTCKSGPVLFLLRPASPSISQHNVLLVLLCH